MPYFYYGIILFSLGGFFIATYIRAKKESGDTLICPVGTTCDTVVHSSYSKFFGIPVELLGMGYYFLIALSYGALLVRPELATQNIIFSLFALTAIALLFSFYLTVIQAFTLRQWCTWCLISASFSVAIFILMIASAAYGFMDLLAGHKALLLGAHIFGVALGLGGATIANILFIQAIKDLRISNLESATLKNTYQLIWFALALIIISGLGFYLPEAASYNQSPEFLVKIIAIGVIIINGVILNFLVSPSLVKISFGRQHQHQPGELHKIRKIAFASGAVSLVSWYSVFVLGLLKAPQISFYALVLIYIGMVLAGVVVSLYIEKTYGKKIMLPQNKSNS